MALWCPDWIVGWSFSFVGVVVDILFLVVGASGWSVPTAVATVVGDGDNERLWKKDEVVCVEGIVAPFCFPFFGTEYG